MRRLLAREHRAGAAEAGHDLVGDQLHAVRVHDLARAREIARVVHRHAARALHQRLDDQRRGRRVMLREIARAPPARVDAPRGDVVIGGAAVRATAAADCAAQQRRVRVAEHRDVGDGERADRLAVIAAGEPHEAALVRLRRDCASSGSSS